MLYKIKAYNDRDYRAKHSSSEKEIEYLQSKRDKDGSDIIALFDAKHSKQRIDHKRLQELMEETGITQMVRTTIIDAFNNPASVSKYAKLNAMQINRLYSKERAKVSTISKEEVKTYLETVVKYYKNEAEESRFKSKFPFYAFPVRTIGVLTPTRIYLFFATDGTPTHKGPIELYDSMDLPKLEEVMDDLEPKTNEIARILGVKNCIFVTYISNSYTGATKENAEELALNMFGQHYREISAGRSPITVLAV